MNYYAALFPDGTVATRVSEHVYHTAWKDTRFAMSPSFSRDKSTAIRTGRAYAMNATAFAPTISLTKAQYKKLKKTVGNLARQAVLASF